MGTIKNRRFAQKQLKIRDRFERMYIPKFKRSIKEQYKAVNNMATVFTPEQLLGAIDGLVRPTPIAETFFSYYKVSSPIFANEQLKFIGSEKAFGKPYKTKQDEELVNDLFSEQMVNYARLNAGSRIVSITSKTAKDIRGAVESAVLQASEEGLSIGQTQKLIQKFLNDDFKAVSRYRAEVIARTEINTSANVASDFAAESTGLTLMKAWETSGLKGIRSTHIQAEGEGQIPKHQAHINGLMFPGDPKGTAEEVINCRCTELYFPV